MFLSCMYHDIPHLSSISKVKIKMVAGYLHHGRQQKNNKCSVFLYLAANMRVLDTRRAFKRTNSLND